MTEVEWLLLTDGADGQQLALKGAATCNTVNDLCKSVSKDESVAQENIVVSAGRLDVYSASRIEFDASWTSKTLLDSTKTSLTRTTKLEEDKLYILKGPSTRKPAVAPVVPAKITKDQVKHLLDLGDISVNNTILDRMLARRTAEVSAAMAFADPTPIVSVYRREEAVFGTATKMDIVCEAETLQGNEVYVLDGTLNIDQESNSVFYKAYRDSQSYIVKVPPLRRVAELEADVYSNTVRMSGSVPPVPHLVSVKYVKFKLSSAAHELHGRTAGIVMPFYITTLMQIPRGVSQLNSSYEKLANIEEGLQSLHNAGFCHCDVKPGNIFLAVDHQMFLGDYDAACKAGSEVERTTPMFLPAEFAVLKAQKLLKASPVVDFGMLACTMIWISFGDDKQLGSSPTLAKIQSVCDMLDNQSAGRRGVISRYIAMAKEDDQHSEGAALLTAITAKSHSSNPQLDEDSDQKSLYISPLL